ncbi:FtsK/SpoIIIE domain-containing protein [Schlesneria paludicola]|uniref:FtsK/SpoIIIE domain-containing protein n=1 Tax=Schlesneria paludicola TaxID=360056 RepID=UPI00029A889A|nr:FtsK/SpoIIIE domain-containing protein [Schlesneria paludicola]
MAVTLTVSEIRRALSRAGGQPGDGAPSTAGIGTLFHRILSELLRPDSPCNVESVVRPLDADLSLWRKTLTRHAYDQLLGPLLTQQSAGLQSHGDKVESLWIAVCEACDLLAEMWWEITAQGRQPADQRSWFFAEQQVVREIQQAGWREPVAIVGQADAIVRVPQKSHWCVLEWKLGRASPEVDLGQACLYHLILENLTEINAKSALALISFRPERTETVFEQSRLVDAQQRLIDLIGHLAGVAPGANRSVARNDGATQVGSNQTGANQVATSRSLARSEQPIPAEIRFKVTTEPPLQSWANELKEVLLRALKQSGAGCRELKPPSIGPTFARYFVFPERGVSVRRVASQAEQLHLYLGLESPPNIAVVDGSIAIDLPRPDRVSIPFSELSRHLPSTDGLLGCSKIPIGVDLSGDWEWCDLAGSESAHMLVVGTPGSGKSQWLRAALASLLSTNHRETLQLLLIDPKQNAFQFARTSPLLRQPIVVPNPDDNVSEILEGLISEMESRNRLFATASCQDLTQYVRHSGSSMPRIVCMCDEYADLLLQAERPERAAIERALKRLAGMGRSAGIHLILATQQPRRDIVTPAIKSLIGAKIALRVSSPIESRVALNESGAECLLGNGDLLYQCLGSPRRLQGAWLPSDEERMFGTVNHEPLEIPRAI